MKRCFIPPTFGKVKDCSLHYFYDGCKKGYGQVTYLRGMDEIGKSHCSLVMGKAQVAPLKYITILKMELVAATLSVEISLMSWPVLESMGMQAIFQKKDHKSSKKGKIFENLGKMHKISKYFEKGQPHVCSYHIHETARICPGCDEKSFNFQLQERIFWTDSEAVLGYRGRINSRLLAKRTEEIG